MIDASKFANQKTISPFGISADDAANALRRMATEIEAGRILVSKVMTGSVADPQDFTLHFLHIRYAETRPREPEAQRA